MELLPETQTLLTQVEELSGLPVEILQDAEQPYLARITRAKPGVPAHLLRINPTLVAPDYLIVYECAFIVRMYALPPDERREFADMPAGRWVPWESLVTVN